MQDLDLKNIYLLPLPIRILMLIGICIFIFFFAYFLDFSTLKKQINANTQQENDLFQQTKIMFHNQKELKEEISYLPYLKNEISTWQKKLVQRENLSELLNEILEKGKVNGLQFQLFNPEEEQTADDYKKVPVKILAIGNYNQIGNFLSQLANMPWIISIDTLDVQAGDENATSKPPDGAARGNLTANMVLDVYYSPEKNQ
jgi:type IV pilus assembly protein PilO